MLRLWGALDDTNLLSALRNTGEGLPTLRTQSKIEYSDQGKFTPPKGCRQPLPKLHRNYLESRGFCPDEIEEEFRVAGTKGDSRLPWRIVIPVIHRGKPVSWVARSVRDDVRPKYIAAKREWEDIYHKSLLYNGDSVLGTVIICEGPTDVWRVGRGAVATFGLTPSDEQVRRLLTFHRRIICYDATLDAQKQARRLSRRLASSGRTEIVQLDAEDPGSASPGEIQELRKYASLE